MQLIELNSLSILTSHQSHKSRTTNCDQAQIDYDTQKGPKLLSPDKIHRLT